MAAARAPAAALRRARAVRFMAFDVDGVKLLARAGIATAILSARKSRALARRARELGIDHVVMGAEDKRDAFAKLLARARVDAAAAGYMGDDLVDLPVLRRCGFACAPANAQALVRANAHYVSRARGGEGAVREACEFVLRAQGRLEDAHARYLA